MVFWLIVDAASQAMEEEGGTRGRVMRCQGNRVGAGNGNNELPQTISTLSRPPPCKWGIQKISNHPRVACANATSSRIDKD